MESKYMVVISFDAVSSEDIEVLKNLPNFKKLIENGSWIKRVDSIYPTLTYPAHTTIVTGKYPNNHRIIDNTIFKVGDFVPNWYWYRNKIKGQTLYDLAMEKGLTTCSLLWPVTGKAKITYNMPEIFAVKPYQHQLFMSAGAGTLGFQLDINKRFGNLRKGIEQPYLDNFVIEAAKYTIKKYAPNLMLIHFTDVDTNRHHYGYRNNVIDDAFIRHDKRLGEIIDALKERGIYDECTIVALGDHSHLDASKVIKLNALFRKEGLIKINEKGKVLDYKSICKSLDGSCYIYLKDKNDTETIEKIKSLIADLPIDFILEGNEIRDAGGDEEASFMIEASLDYYFVDDIYGEVIDEIKDEEVGVKPHRHKATHGYSPKKENYTTFFIGSGRGFKKGVVIDKGNLINHGPTLAKILGLKFKDIDGEAIEEILNIDSVKFCMKK